MIHFKILLTIIFFIYSDLNSEEYIEQVGPPWGYTFEKWSGPNLDIIVYIPPSALENTPLLIVVPGASRDAQRFHGSWLDLAKKNNFSVLTIGAKKNFFPDELSYNAGGVIGNDGNLAKKEEWLFSAIEPIFIDFKERFGFNIDGFFLFGHSAGGGFVHRFLLFEPDAPVLRAAAANPAFVTLPNKQVPYPFGLKDAPVNNEMIRLWLQKDLAIVLGLEDLGPRTKPLSNGLMARRQGSNCLERGKLLHHQAEERSKDLDANFQWELILVPNVGHDNYNIAPSACKYLFGE